jgi:hypothetical protein
MLEEPIPLPLVSSPVVEGRGVIKDKMKYGEKDETVEGCGS